MKSKTLVLVVCLMASHSLFSQADKGSYSIGLSPTYPIFGGYGAKAFYNFPKKWSIGILTEGSFDLPEFAEKNFFNNADAINVKWDYSIGIEARYRFRKADNDIKGLYCFSTLGYEPWTINKSENTNAVSGTKQEDKFDNWFASIGIGYNWFPIKNKGLWIGAAYNTIFILNNNSDRTVNGSTYNLKSIVPPTFTPNIYVGWRFNN
jgi:Outer membrane protein beta-barrel domain